MPEPSLYWLLEAPNWAEAIAELDSPGTASWTDLVRLARHRFDFIKTAKLDKLAQKSFEESPPAGLPTKPIRLAVLGSATVEHLIAGIRVGMLRRNMYCSTYSGAYGQYHQEILDPRSGLHAFRPSSILLSLDARHLLGALYRALDSGAASKAVDDTVEGIRALWRRAQDEFGCSVIQQTAMPLYPPLMGNNEHRLPNSPRRLIDRFNQRLLDVATEENVDILALDLRISEDGLDAWHNPVLWFRAKQEIALQAAPFYGDLVARLLAAGQGQSFKCIAVDLDNTLWGGVIGDDGLAKIILGQGSTLGEAYSAFQEYLQQLVRRGIILAVCSKNDEAIAVEAFDSHPEMILRRNDIAAFVANWSDKPTNLRLIAEQLNIGVDSIVFVDDNRFERELVRRELPMVAVPELPEDPALFPRCLADAGYFEANKLTPEDFQRTKLYQTRAVREGLLASATDMDAYLKSLEMKLVWQRIDDRGMTRAVQLINKTNQFNLTTRRYTQSDMVAILQDDRSIALQLRLIDTLGDNGIIAVVITKPDNDDSSTLIDTWLMSCRVLGREVERATLNLLVDQARKRGLKRIIGEYRPTAKNKMVKDHFRSLGFGPLSATAESSLWQLPIDSYTPLNTAIELVGND